MTSFIEHELSAYRHEIDQLAVTKETLAEATHGEVNFTHWALGRSNRGNMILVSLCALVEASLTVLALAAEDRCDFKLDDIRKNGPWRAELFLRRAGLIDLGGLVSWGDFVHLYKVRNEIVHGYGGLVPPRSQTKVAKRLRALNMTDCLVGLPDRKPKRRMQDRDEDPNSWLRIRMTHRALTGAHEIVTRLLAGLPGAE